MATSIVAKIAAMFKGIGYTSPTPEMQKGGHEEVDVWTFKVGGSDSKASIIDAVTFVKDAKDLSSCGVKTCKEFLDITERLTNCDSHMYFRGTATSSKGVKHESVWLDIRPSNSGMSKMVGTFIAEDGSERRTSMWLMLQGLVLSKGINWKIDGIVGHLVEGTGNKRLSLKTSDGYYAITKDGSVSVNTRIVSLDKHGAKYDFSSAEEDISNPQDIFAAMGIMDAPLGKLKEARCLFQINPDANLKKKIGGSNIPNRLPSAANNTQGEM